jgi:hypothetical protein
MEGCMNMFEEEKSKGFVTLAVGERKYFELAKNLLKSYKFHTNNPLPFAIVADRENDVTKLFDRIILLENPSCSYMDKLDMLNHAPFDENIFIDADCLAYGDLNEYWTCFGNAGGVRCFGHKLPLCSSQGWFNIDDIGEYKNQIKFELQMHGGIIYFAKDELTTAIYGAAKDIVASYDRYKFRYFDQPADEPILALSMAINNCPPVEWSVMNDRAYLFLPVASKVICNILTQELAYTKDGGDWISDVMLLHWQNVNTEKAMYWREVQRLNTGKDILDIRYAIVQLKIFIKTKMKRLQKRIG